MVYYVCGCPYSDELYHHGIRDQKWGIRRFQNADGTLTPAGKERYGRGNSDKNTNSESKGNAINKEKLKKAAKIAGAAVGTAAVAYGAYKLGSSNLAREFVASQKLRSAMIKNAGLKALHSLNDEELAGAIGRLKAEADFRNLTYRALTSSANPKHQMFIDSGKKIIGSALTGIGTYAGYAALSKKFDSKEAARYMFSNPNKKKNS